MSLNKSLLDSAVDAYCTDCHEWLSEQRQGTVEFDLTFLDPPFNQGKAYRKHDDSMVEAEYWSFMKQICQLIHAQTVDGGAIYFMQREKNAEQILRTLRETGWTFHNMVVWKKLTSAIPSKNRYGKAYQVIVFATKGTRAQAFNKLRITPRLPAGYQPHPAGVYVTDIWDDIRELTSGYFAGDEAMRDVDGNRKHKQQTPIALLLRLILSSTLPGMNVLDPFAGTGTTAIVASQLGRRSVALEIDQVNYTHILERLTSKRPCDDLASFRPDYIHTESLNDIWPIQPSKLKKPERDQANNQTKQLFPSSVDS